MGTILVVANLVPCTSILDIHLRSSLSLRISRHVSLREWITAGCVGCAGPRFRSQSVEISYGLGELHQHFPKSMRQGLFTCMSLVEVESRRGRRAVGICALPILWLLALHTLGTLCFVLCTVYA